MDPNETLQRLRTLSQEIEQQEDKWIDEESTTHAIAAIGEELATCFEALDEWLTRGGHLPEEWQNSRWNKV